MSNMPFTCCAELNKNIIAIRSENGKKIHNYNLPLIHHSPVRVTASFARPWSEPHIKRSTILMKVTISCPPFPSVRCPTIHQNWSNYFTLPDRRFTTVLPLPAPYALSFTLYTISWHIPFLCSNFTTFHRSLDIHTCPDTLNEYRGDCIGNFVRNKNVTHQNSDGGTLALANLKAKYNINRATIKIVIWDVHNFLLFCLQSFCFWGSGTETK